MNRQLQPASVSLPNAGPETYADAPDIEFECKHDGTPWLWTEQVGDHGAFHVEPLDYYSWSIRFWHHFDAPLMAWQRTSEGRFAAYLARRDYRARQQ